MMGPALMRVVRLGKRKGGYIGVWVWDESGRECERFWV